MSSAHFFSFAVPLGVARSGRWAVAAITTALLAACASPPVTQPAPPIRPMPRADLLAGQWYVNIRTARYPDGELRGQLIERH